MSEFIPVSTIADLDTLDEHEMVDGYLDGLADAPEPGNNRSRSYWHGWRNGMRDRGKLGHDSASHQLASEYVNRLRDQAA